MPTGGVAIRQAVVITIFWLAVTAGVILVSSAPTLGQYLYRDLERELELADRLLASTDSSLKALYADEPDWFDAFVTTAASEARTARAGALLEKLQRRSDSLLQSVQYVESNLSTMGQVLIFQPVLTRAHLTSGRLQTAMQNIRFELVARENARTVMQGRVQVWLILAMLLIGTIYLFLRYARPQPTEDALTRTAVRSRLARRLPFARRGGRNGR